MDSSIIPTYAVGLSITLMAILISTRYFSREWPFNLKEILNSFIPDRDILWSKVLTGLWTLEIEMKFYLVCTLLILRLEVLLQGISGACCSFFWRYCTSIAWFLIGERAMLPPINWR